MSLRHSNTFKSAHMALVFTAFLVFAAITSAEIRIGSKQEEVISQIGSPRAKMIRGGINVYLYDDSLKIHLRRGAVTQIINPNNAYLGPDDNELKASNKTTRQRTSSTRNRNRSNATSTSRTRSNAHSEKQASLNEPHSNESDASAVSTNNESSRITLKKKILAIIAVATGAIALVSLFTLKKRSRAKALKNPDKVEYANDSAPSVSATEPPPLPITHQSKPSVATEASDQERVPMPPPMPNMTASPKSGAPATEPLPPPPPPPLSKTSDPEPHDSENESFKSEEAKPTRPRFKLNLKNK